MIGKLLKRKREKLGYTQQDIAIRLNVTQSRVSAWENGAVEPNGKYTVMLGYMLDISIDEYFKEYAKNLRVYGKDK